MVVSPSLVLLRRVSSGAGSLTAGAGARQPATVLKGASSMSACVALRSSGFVHESRSPASQAPRPLSAL